MKPITRQRIYDTGIGVFGLLGVWGIFTLEEVAGLTDLLDNILGVGVLLLARRNVPTLVAAEADDGTP